MESTAENIVRNTVKTVCCYMVLYYCGEHRVITELSKHYVVYLKLIKHRMSTIL